MKAANDNGSAIADLVEKFSGGDGIITIYGLSGNDDPTSPSDCRYVGLTRQTLSARRVAHIREASATNADGTLKFGHYRANWIRSVLTAGDRSALRIAPIVTGLSAESAGKAEKEFIAAYRAAGARLTNATAGGEGVPASPEQKIQSKRDYMRTYQANRRAGDDEYAARCREANRGSMNKRYANDNEFRTSTLAKAKARRNTDSEFREYMLEYGRAYRARKKAERLAA